MENTFYVLIVLIVLGVIAGIAIWRKGKERQNISKLGAVSFAMVIAGIVFGENRFLGYSLMGLGILLAFADIFIKSKNNGGSVLIEKQAQEKGEHLKKIMDFISGKDRITNDDVQELLGVSDSTVQRYLNQLEEQGEIKQFGETGQVYYTKN